MRTAVALSFALTLVVYAAPAVAENDTITLVLTGDVGLNRSNLKVDESGVLEGKGVLRWSEMTEGIAPLIDGDLNFMNLETVVTDKNDLKPGDKKQDKPYLFRTHPKGVEHLAEVGFNLISAANNHSYDYGEEGARETVRHLSKLAKSKKIHFAGIGENREQASRPTILRSGPARVAFSAIGIVTNMLKFHCATENKPGTLGFRYKEDWKEVTDRLGEAEADLRVLSIHYGRERDIRTDSRQLEEYRWAARERGVDLVVGHHAHVVRGVELHKGTLIFYGLGNFLIRGARDMGKSPELRGCCDYGLLAEVHMMKGESGRYRAVAVEVVPVMDMHRKPKPIADVEIARKRIEVLNVLAEKLDDDKAGSVGVRFQARADGTGLYCVDGAAKLGGKVGALCSTYVAATAPSAEARRYVARAPDPSRASKTRKARRSKARQRKQRKRRR